ncbi:RusA family crossover junction endodeoxyribonuclease [Longimicrobium sp.]|uniref:RusA family crossover junction endodeoxyribonuclease n=1 Tax=Longimicrobium sp. TaxID=2029185 RepID=UPI003B3B2646
MLPLDVPPEHGVITFDVAVAPVSLQSTGARKAGVVSAVRACVSGCEYLLGGDVKIAIQWQISERARYESDSAADVDNIVKPILDALSGPDGIMVDDCQVQELTCYWTGGYADPETEQISIELRFEPGAYLRKSGLLFLRVENGLYFPIHDDVDPRAILYLAEHLIRRFQIPRELTAIGIDPQQAHITLPIQRVFHRSKLGSSFRTTTLEEVRERFG